MKPLAPSQAREIAGGRQAPELIDGPTFPPYQIDPLPDAEPLPVELVPDQTVR